MYDIQSIDKKIVLASIIRQLEADLQALEQAVAMAHDTATHADCLGSSKYETMGLEASYLAQGQGTRLLEVERALTHFQSLIAPEAMSVVGMSALVALEDDDGVAQLLWVAAEAGGLKLLVAGNQITVITAKSPLGRALIGKQAGDVVEITLAGRSRTYTALRID